MARLAAAILLGLTFVSAPAAQAASFDCAKATAPVEKLICGDPRVSAADSSAASAFAEALSLSPSPDALRREQRAWLANDRNKAKTADELLQAYADRETALHTTIAGYRFERTAFDAAQAAHSCVRAPSLEGACTVQKSGRLADAPGGELVYQIQSYAGEPENQAVVVLTAAEDGKLRPVAWLGTPGATYDAPIIIRHEATTLLYLPGQSGGTGVFPDDELLAWQDGEWREIDTNSWLYALAKRLPKGLTANKGTYPDWATMTATTDLWRPMDANCCPSGGRARIMLKLVDQKIELVSVGVSRSGAARTPR